MSAGWVVAIAVLAAALGAIAGGRAGYAAGRVQGWFDALPTPRRERRAPVDPTDREA